MKQINPRAARRINNGKATRLERKRLGLPKTPTRRERPPVALPANPHEFIWFVLTTKPQAEDKAARRLVENRFVAFNPVELIKTRASRRVKYARKTVERALLTSMILFGYPIDGLRQLPWRDVLAPDLVTGVLGMGEWYVPVPISNVLDLMRRTGCAGRTRKWAPEVGEVAQISTGPYRDKLGRVVQLEAGTAALELLGLSGVFAEVKQNYSVPETWLSEPDHEAVS